MLGDPNSTYVRRHIKIINYLRYLIIVKTWKGTEKTNMENWNIHESVEYYKGQDAPQNQFALVELLKEVQEHNGGVLADNVVQEIAALLNIKPSFLNAVIKRYPSLKPAAAPHRLEICGGKNCAGNGSAALLKFIKQTYNVDNGGISVSGGFSFAVCNCLKHCGKGPNIKWDGEVYNAATPELIKRLCGK